MLERQEFYRIIKLARTWLAQYPVTASDKTLAQYRAACERMKERNVTPFEMAGKSKRAFYFYRAALIAGLLRELDVAIKEAIDTFEAGDMEQCLKCIKRTINCSNAIREHNPDPGRERKNTSEMGLWAAYVETQKITPSRYTKNETLRTLPKNWRAKIWQAIAINSKYRLPLAVLACCGCRPGELELGVDVELVDQGIQLTVKGLKTHGGKYGQDQRTVVISGESSEGEFLADCLAEAGGHLTVTARARPLKDAIRRISKRIWTDRRPREHVSPYCYRHQVASDMKVQGLPIEEIAKALGHSVDDTQRQYGHIRRGRGGGNKVLRVMASREVRKTWRQPPRTRQKRSRISGLGKP